MEMVINGKIYVLGDNIDTDQIIPAYHLIYSLEDPEERKKYAPLAFSGVPEENRDSLFINPDAEKSDFSIVIAGENFGCGSSREHATVCLELAGVRAVVAKSFARIFYRNVISGARFVPIIFPELTIKDFQTGDDTIIDLRKRCIQTEKSKKELTFPPLGETINILASGGIFEYARRNNLI